MSPENVAPRVLVVDDEPGLRALLEEVLKRERIECRTAASGAEALQSIEAEHFDIIVTDIRMPGMSGIDLMKTARERCDSDIMVLTAFSSDYHYEAIVAEGAADFILKPCRPTEFVMRIRRVLAQRALRLERDRAQSGLHDAMAQIREAYLDTIHRLSIATEYKDIDTGDHIVRMGCMSSFIAENAGMNPEECENVMYAAPMHDVGKIGIPDSILLKAGRLTPQEFEVMKTHTTIGASILEKPRSAILECARVIALTHHEQWDGGGYPQGLAGDKIPLVGRIVKLVDVFDALVSSRPYKTAYPLDIALSMMKKDRERHFDPALFDILYGKIDQIMQIRKGIGDMEPAEHEYELSERDALYASKL